MLIRNALAWLVNRSDARGPIEQLADLIGAEGFFVMRADRAARLEHTGETCVVILESGNIRTVERDDWPGAPGFYRRQGLQAASERIGCTVRLGLAAPAAPCVK